MKPLNYAILQHFTKIKEACADDILIALKDQYSHFKAFEKHSITTALMTAEANGLIEEARFDLDSDNKIRIYYRAHPEGAAIINTYIKD